MRDCYSVRDALYQEMVYGSLILFSLSSHSSAVTPIWRAILWSQKLRRQLRHMQDGGTSQRWFSDATQARETFYLACSIPLSCYCPPGRAWNAFSDPLQEAPNRTPISHRRKISRYATLSLIHAFAFLSKKNSSSWLSDEAFKMAWGRDGNWHEEIVLDHNKVGLLRGGWGTQ